MSHPKNLGYSFIIKGKVGSGRRTCLSFFLSSFFFLSFFLSLFLSLSRFLSLFLSFSFLNILGQCPISSDTLS